MFIYELLLMPTDLLRPLIELGILVQVTASSIEGSFGDTARKCAMSLLKSGMVHLCASAAHSPGGRKPGLSRARKVVESMLPPEDSRRIFDLNPAKVLAGDFIEPLEMSEEDFKDMVRQNLRNMAKDIIYNLSGLAMYFGAIAIAPADDDEDKYAKNMHKFMVRLLDKFTDELAYYSPAALAQVLNTDFFPALGVLTTFSTAMKKLLYDTWAVTIDDEELEKKTHTIKYFLKSLPVTSSLPPTFLCLLQI